MYNKILSVTDINNYIKKIIDNDFILRNSHIRGELSNVKLHSSGHIYFSLKDNYTKIKGVMFKSRAMSLNFIPKDGMQVIISGNISVYDKEGVYQLYCDTMEVAGEGELYLAFNKLKAKLEDEGLFDSSRKQQIPLMPRRIGVVTSPTGAAVRDIIRVAKRRNSKVDILIYPALVQGISAAQDVATGIAALNKIEDIDLIIVARGGGSIEELWAFNEEVVARAIAASKKPIVTGVGHETDFTIADFVADYRAATPSHAAEVSTYSLDSLQEKLEDIKDDMANLMGLRISDNYNYLKIIEHKLKMYSPEKYIVNQYDKIDNLKSKLNFSIKLILQDEKNKMKIMGEKLVACNPLNILDKGYGIFRDDEGSTIESIAELKKHDKVLVTMKDGSMIFNMKGVEK
ncbi:MAG: exodeoxyribonuclease VII large subunit [Clostridium sp.]|nr:exodeoxyribonuclease VII large subunit [Clostridium sp.]